MTCGYYLDSLKLTPNLLFYCCVGRFLHTFNIVTVVRERSLGRAWSNQSSAELWTQPLRNNYSEYCLRSHSYPWQYHRRMGILSLQAWSHFTHFLFFQCHHLRPHDLLQDQSSSWRKLFLSSKTNKKPHDIILWLCWKYLLLVSTLHKSHFKPSDTICKLRTEKKINCKL